MDRDGAAYNCRSGPVAVPAGGADRTDDRHVRTELLHGCPGAKRVMLGDEAYLYDAHHYLITSVHLPTVVQVTEASRDKPYLGLRLKFDLREISQLMADSNLPSPRTQQ